MRNRTIRCDPTKLITTVVALSVVAAAVVFDGASAEFFIGEYHTTKLSSDYSDRNGVVVDDEQHPKLHMKDEIFDEDERSNELVDNGRSWSGKRRQALAFSTFNPLTPGGTIYLAFMFLIPLTVGKNLGKRRSYTSKTAGLLEHFVHKVQQDQQSIYSEMGYVDGNLMLRRAWRDLRRGLMRRLTPWRNDANDVKSNRINRKKKKKKKRKWKPWK